MSSHHSMPIAVVGMSCRFPGDATNVEAFWDFITQGRSAATEIPKDRFNIDAYYHPSSTRQGSINVRKGHFLKEDVSRFDAPFFSITKNEADATDPQQRLLLEVAYEAFENAGMSMTTLAGSPTSVYSANFSTDYKQISAFDSEDQPDYGSTGHSTALIANRVSWFFDLRGPSMTLDTGCSGSAVAFHLACESLRTGDAECALACGVNLLLAPEPWMSMTAFNFLSPDGVCYTFDHRANGYSRGEGFAAIVLKPLDKAIRDNDTIRAVVRTTAVAQDGKTPGITLASRDAQASLLRSTYRKAGLEMSQTGYFEAHGTGTVAGDGAELGAIGDAFSGSRPGGEHLLVGSVKTNVGHLEGTSSLAGIIKAILSVERGVIPGNLNFEKPNPKNDLEKYKISVPVGLTPWPSEGMRRASINCFGFGGTIAHVILDSASHYAAENGLAINHDTAEASRRPSQDSDPWIRIELEDGVSPAPPRCSESSPWRLVVLSSPEQDGNKRNANNLRAYVDSKNSHESLDLNEIAYTLNLRRTQFQWRSSVVAQDAEQLSKGLQDCPKAIKAIEDPRICFVFTGQGAQWEGMGKELLRYPTFRASVEAADASLTKFGLDWTVLSELEANTSSRLTEPAVSQTACTVLQCALVDLLASWSVKPAVCIGHSSGEIAVAYAAGALRREDAWKIAYYRGVFSARTTKGAMLAVGIGAEEAQGHIDRLGHSGVLDVACLNSPKNTTISGDESGIGKLQTALGEAMVFNRRLKVECAYHSSHMRSVAEVYEAEIEDIGMASTDCDVTRMFSSVSGSELDLAKLRPAYFVENLVSPVLFQQALATAYQTYDIDLVVEIGPHSALQSAIKQTLKPLATALPQYISILSRGEDAHYTALKSAGLLWNSGVDVDLSAVNKTNARALPKCLADLPSYSWNHTRSYWWEAQQSKAHRHREHPRLELLGAPEPAADSLHQRWRNVIRTKEMPWVMDHQVQNTILYPAAGMLIMVIEAARQMVGDQSEPAGFELTDVTISKAIVISNGSQGLETILTISSSEDNTGKLAFAVSSRSGEATWQKNCEGLLRICSQTNAECKSTAVTSHFRSFGKATQECLRNISPRSLYEQFELLGMHWGPSFQNISLLQTSEHGKTCSIITVPDIESLLPAHYQQPHLIHPATLDAMLQTIVAALPPGSSQKVPTSIGYLYVATNIPSTTSATFEGFAIARNVGLRDAVGTVEMHVADTDQLAVIMEDVVCSAVDAPSSTYDDAQSTLCSTTIWREDIDLVDQNSLIDALDQSASPTGTPSASPEDQLAKYLQLATFKNPNMSILEINVGNGSFTRRILAAITGSSGLKANINSYTFSDCKDHYFEAIQAEHYTKATIDFKKLDIDQSPLEQGFRPDSFDMITASGLSESVTDVNRASHNVCLILRPGGRLLVEESENGPISGSAVHAPGWRRALELAGFELLGEAPQRQNKAIMIARKPDSRADLARPRTVILHSGKQDDFSALAREVYLRLATHTRVSTILLEEADQHDLANSVVICMLEPTKLGVLDWSDTLLSTMKSVLPRNQMLLWLTRGAQLDCENPQATSALGILRALRYEDSRLKPYTLDLDPCRLREDLQVARDAVVKVWDAITSSKAHAIEYEFAERNGRIFIPRLHPETVLNKVIAPNAISENEKIVFDSTDKVLGLEIAVPGQLDSLRFRTSKLAAALPEDHVEIRVTTNCVHAVDVKTMMGETSASTFGYSVGGIVTSIGSEVYDLFIGDRVVLLQPGTLSNVVHAKHNLVCKIPSNVDIASLVAFAAEYTTAQYALVEVAKAKPGERCLVYDAASLLGQAMVQLARHYGVRVFAAVHDSQESAVLVRHGLVDQDHILSAVDVIARSRHDQANYDVILCATSQGKTQNLWSRIAPFGRMIEVVSSSTLAKSKPSQLAVHTSACFSTVDMELVRKHRPQMFKSALMQAVSFLSDGATRFSGTMKELPYSGVTEAYQLVQSDEKSSVVLTAHKNDQVPVAVEDIQPLHVHLRSDATYLIVGGLGGLGRSIASYLVRSGGAKHIAFLSRSGGQSSEVQDFLRSLEKEGAYSAKAFACDVADETKLRSALSTLEAEMPPIKGVINSAMLLRDALFENMTHSDWTAALRPKILGSLNLHNLSPQNLDFFILLSSIAGVGGMRGQTNYAAGNAYQAALARHRRSQNLPAVCIDLTVVLGVGVVAENPELIDGLKQAGVLSIREEELHALIKAAITGFTSNKTVTPAQITVGVATGAYLERNNIQDPIWNNDNRFLHMCKLGLSASSSSAAEDTSIDLGTLLPAAKSLREATKAIIEALTAKLAKALGMQVEDIEISRSVSDYGVDSLAAVELRNWIQRQAKATVSIFDLMSQVPIRELAGRIAGGSLLLREGLRVPAEEKFEV